jgi:glycosyltransferase involved in cell wall biosynthesis
VPYPVFPISNGGHKAIAEFLYFLSREIEVEVLTVEANEPRFAQGYQIDNSLSGSRFRYIDFRLRWKIAKIIQEKAITHLMIEHPYFGWLGVWLKKATGVKLVVRSHNIEGMRWYSMGKWWWNWMRRYEQWVHRQADFSFFITPEDEAVARTEYHIPKTKCEVITYGTRLQEVPSAAERARFRAQIVDKHLGGVEKQILLFVGSFDYLPNIEALSLLANEIMPQLRQHNRKYQLLICGGHLARAVDDLELPECEDISYIGFVDRIEDYYLGADIFLNPILSGGGIKTKLVEALSYGAAAVTTTIGSTGVPDYFTGQAMIKVPDGDIDAFTHAVFNHPRHQVTQLFFQHFYWGTLADRAASALENC